MKFNYRLSKKKKQKIAQNLIDILEKEQTPLMETVSFIGNWILTPRDEKFKAFYDVWELVLKNYMPKTSPILIRSIERKSKAEYIASFTNSAYCANRFSTSFGTPIKHNIGNGEYIELSGQGKGYWIICDTKQTVKIFEKAYKKGEYKYTFYPLSEVFKKAKANGGWGFSDDLINTGIGEDEYIMKINYSIMNLLKFIN